MNRNSFIPFILLAIGVTSLADIEMKVGDGLIDGAKLNPYHLTWHQCSLKDGRWQGQGVLTEELIVIGDLVLRHRQTTRQSNGVESRLDTFFDRSSFAPLRMEMEATQDGSRLAYSERNFDANGYTGIAVKGTENKILQGIISSNMLHGGALGLPLATMDFQDAPVSFLASMISFDGTYDVVAEWVGKETLSFDGRAIEAWLIDVEWHHRESGDIYPPGPDASGGRFWVVTNPPPGYPYVPRYETDIYAVEFVEAKCPTATNKCGRGCRDREP